MSFKDGNLREKVADLNREIDSMRRRLGGSQAANNRLKQKIRSLEEEILYLKKRVRELEGESDETKTED